MTNQNANAYLLAVIQQQEFLGMMGLGKLADPTSGEAQVDLDKTRYAIGVLEMLEEKTAGNLHQVEEQNLRRVLTALRLNFVEATRPGQPEGAGDGGAAQADAPEDGSKDKEA